MKTIFIATLLFLVAILPVHAQKIAVKTNLLYGAYALTPTMGVELKFDERTTIDINTGYNWFNRNGSATDNKKRVHWFANAEYRYWLGKAFNGHFFGAHALGGQYNISGHNLPWLLEKGSTNYRYEGHAYGAGISYGYQWTFSKHWSVEGNIGVGYMRMEYDKYQCDSCADKIGPGSKNYFGPTKAGVSMIYLF